MVTIVFFTIVREKLAIHRVYWIYHPDLKYDKNVSVQKRTPRVAPSGLQKLR